MVVVDASVVIDLLLRAQDAEALTARLLDPKQCLTAPHLLDVEVAQVLRRQRPHGFD
jgi:predicted nucleic acid-binding protein